MAIDYEFNPPLGIDLGTTFSAIAKWNGTRPEAYRSGARGRENTPISCLV